MQINHADLGADTSNEIRGGARQFSTLLKGHDDSPDNYRLVLNRQDGHVYSPRHKHNFDQLRMLLAGEPVPYGKEITVGQGEIGYFPEGAPYGPEDTNTRKLGLTIQFGGASGEGFVSGERMAEGQQRLKAFGVFEDGIFKRTGPLPPGTRRNQDGFEAIWEHLYGRKVKYPAPRYPGPMLMKPQNFAWLPVAGEPGHFVKRLATFTERQLEVGMTRLDAGAAARIAPRPGTQLGFVLKGAGAIDGRGLRLHSAFALEPGEAAVLTATEDMELLAVGLPIFAERLKLAS